MPSKKKPNLEQKSNIFKNLNALDIKFLPAHDTLHEIPPWKVFFSFYFDEMNHLSGFSVI